ncbi:MAG TPA: nickel ABC transporter permease [Chloroflexi bacterium]|jgi:peptide/nickel transport system permease protein|nr:nickel ABC transporter permease [Chloroflexota bacterium]
MTVDTSQTMSLAGSEHGVRKPRSAWDRARRNRNLMLGLGLFALLVLIAIAAPLLAPFDPFALDYGNTLQPPSLAHLFGTDHLGRDIFSRVLFGARIDLRVGIISVISPFIIGMVLGSLAGFYGGWADTYIMRLVDVVQAFPFLILVIAIVAVRGPGLQNMYIAVALVAWIVYARLVRGEILVEKNKEYVHAARAIGSTDWRIMRRHLLPNVITTSVVYAMADIALYILLAAALSFLGLGAKPPTPEWGVMITEGRQYITTAWWISALPGLAIVLTGIILSLIGDGLADFLRPERR